MANNQTPAKALNLDAKSQRKFIDFFRKQFDEEASMVFRLFERNGGEFYSIHGKDTAIALKTSLKSSIVVKSMNPDESPGLIYASFNKNLFEKILRELLIIIGYKVEVYTTSGGQDQWALEYKGSPGNLAQFEEILFKSSEPEIFNNLLLSLQILSAQQQIKIGLSCIDSSERIISVAEIEDSVFYNELEAIVVLMSPKECLIPTTTGEYAKVKEVLERNGILVSVQKKSQYTADASFLHDLEKLIHFKKGQKKSVHTIPELKLELAMGSVAAGVRYLELINDDSNMGKFEMKTLNMNRFVHLDSAAVHALNLFPPADVNYRSTLYKWQSVLGVLDRCKTNQGRRLLQQWLKQPLKNVDLIKERQDVIENLINYQDVRSVLHKDHLSNIPDVLMLSNKLSRKRANLQDVFKIYQIILRIPEILRLLKAIDNPVVKSVLYDRFAEVHCDLKMYEEMVEQVLDLESVKHGEYLIQADFDEKLAEVRKEMDLIEAKMKKELKSCASTAGLQEGPSFKLDYVSHLGYHFRSTKKEEQKLRNHKMFKTIDTARGGLRFTTEKLQSLNHKFTDLKADYEEKQKEIVEEIVRVASGYSSPFLNLNQAIASLDVFVSLSEVASDSPGVYVRPKIYSADDRILDLKALRHPCLECQDEISYIPNDISMKGGETNMIIITGANISGKSTYIRSVGVTVLLAHIGSFVPCSEADISICDSILARVGANDNIQKGLSTFMVEMVETSSILQTATKNSLVIIDELGRGTSTFEGIGLAWSIAEYLASNIQCFTLFATHFHEITALADTEKCAKNFHLAAITDSGKLTLLFQVKSGPINKSFGVQVAEIAQLPAIVLSEAKNYLLEIEGEQSDSIKDNEKEIKIHEMLNKIKNGADFDIDMLADL